MRILIAPDKFKGSLSAREVAENIAAGLRAALPAAELTLLPLADGGEGTAEAICAGREAEWVDLPGAGCERERHPCALRNARRGWRDGGV